jgi:creatinine amidohydrolase
MILQLISVLLDENTRRVIRRAIAAGSLRGAIVPLASTEQHNEHLAMNHDARSVAWIARHAAELLFPRVVVTPTLNIGISEHWMDHPGTLTLSEDVFAALVYQVCDSLRRGGINRILLLNGHGGNHRPIAARLDDLRQRLGIALDFCSYWEAYSADLVSQYLESGECPGHAAEFETSVAQALFPEGVHAVDVYPESEVRIKDKSRAEEDRRFFSEAALAAPHKGTIMMNAAVDWVAHRTANLLA